MQFGYTCRIGRGEINLRRFTDLRVLCMWSLASWDALKSLPDSLEELSLQTWNMDDDASATFAISKLPPKLRVLSLDGSDLTLLFDSMAPSTLESLELGLEGHISLQDLENFFETKNLRVLRGVRDLTPESLSKFPNLEKLIDTHKLSGKLSTLEMLPRKLQKLSLLDRMRDSQSISFKHLPPSLKKYRGPILCPEDITELPKTLTCLQIQSNNGRLLPRYPPLCGETFHLI